MDTPQVIACAGERGSCAGSGRPNTSLVGTSSLATADKIQSSFLAKIITMVPDQKCLGSQVLTLLQLLGIPEHQDNRVSP